MNVARRRKAAVTPAAETEAGFQAAVIELAKLRGWLVFHNYDSRRSESGFPDLCLVRSGRVIFAELKTARGTVRPDQREWLMTLALCGGVEVYLWRPSFWAQIEQALR